MLYYERSDISEGIDLAKSNGTKEWFVTMGFLVMYSNFKILYAMVSTMLSVNISRFDNGKC